MPVPSRRQMLTARLLSSAFLIGRKLCRLLGRFFRSVRIDRRADQAHRHRQRRQYTQSFTRHLNFALSKRIIRIAIRIVPYPAVGIRQNQNIIIQYKYIISLAGLQEKS